MSCDLLRPGPGSSVILKRLLNPTTRLVSQSATTNDQRAGCQKQYCVGRGSNQASIVRHGYRVLEQPAHVTGESQFSRREQINSRDTVWIKADPG
jgi:hypothetical protein